MHILLTGATGFIGSRILPELLGAGHRVTGLTRSERGAAALIEAGAEPCFGTLEEPAGIAAAATGVDAVIHAAFDHDFSNFLANCEKDRRVIEALGAQLKGSGRPLLITSGVGIGDPADGQPAREDVFNSHHPNPRIATEQAGQALLDAGVNVSVMRLPQVHDTVRQGLISPYIEMAARKGTVAYVGEGRNRWPAAHVSDCQTACKRDPISALKRDPLFGIEQRVEGDALRWVRRRSGVARPEAHPAQVGSEDGVRVAANCGF